VCHGVWFEKREIETLKDNIPDHEWFDVDLWEKKELLHTAPSMINCPSCGDSLHEMNWDDGKLLTHLCGSCGGMWLPKGEYVKAREYIKNKADDEVIDDYGTALIHQIGLLTSGKKDIENEVHDLATLFRFIEYRFVAMHPILTEVIEELPFSK
jgi:Zn-finger nucleic acid-binding protein